MFPQQWWRHRTLPCVPAAPQHHHQCGPYLPTQEKARSVTTQPGVMWEKPHGGRGLNPSVEPRVPVRSRLTGPCPGCWYYDSNWSNYSFSSQSVGQQSSQTPQHSVIDGLGWPHYKYYISDQIFHHAAPAFNDDRSCLHQDSLYWRHTGRILISVRTILLETT